MHTTTNNIPKMRVNINALNPTQSDNFKEAFSRIMKIRDNRGYTFIAGHHGVPGFYCWHHQRDLARENILRARLFLPWHRAYLKVLEDLLQDHLPNVTLCWWRWPFEEDSDKGLPQDYSSPMWKDNENPLFKFHIDIPRFRLPEVFDPQGLERSLDEDTSREVGSNSNLLLPSEQDIIDILEIEDYGEFSDRLEDIHDNIHGWVGGTMSDVFRAAFDPIFFAHHTNVDRLWRIWQLRHGNSTMPTELLSVPLEPFPYTVQDVLNVWTLGYDYADSSGEINI